MPWLLASPSHQSVVYAVFRNLVPVIHEKWFQQPVPHQCLCHLTSSIWNLGVQTINSLWPVNGMWHNGTLFISKYINTIGTSIIIPACYIETNNSSNFQKIRIWWYNSSKSSPIRRLGNLGATNYKKKEETQALAYTQINGIENNLAEICLLYTCSSKM